MWWFQNKTQPERLYLDNAAATAVRPEVFAAMQPYFSEQYGNASAIHAEGAQAATAVSEARLSVARTLGIRPNEVTFTASGSESNNLAILGYVRQLHEVDGFSYGEIEIISTKIEHPSVLEVLRHLESLGVVVHYTPVDEEGCIVEAELKKLLNTKTRLITFAYANSEIGVVQPVKRITRLVRKFNTDSGTSTKTHLDASQAPLWLSCHMTKLGVDMMTLDAGKCEGPKGVGILTVRNVPILPLVLGGGQESGLRAGTENTAGIVGAAKALELAQEQVGSEYAFDHNNSDANTGAVLLWRAIKDTLPEAILNGPDFTLETLQNGHQVTERRLPNNVNISIPGIDTEFAVVVLDKHGIAASTKSACSGAGSGESGVVKEISNDSARANSTIRFSLGRTTDLSQSEAVRIATILRDHVDQMQALQ